MPKPERPYVGRVGRRKRARTPAEPLIWAAGVVVALAFILLLARQSWPLALVIFLALAAFSWWEWRRE